MASKTTPKQLLMFGFLCIMWGATWIGMKAGTATVPPGVFSGLRWSVAGAVLLGIRAIRGEAVLFPPREFWRVLLVGVLMIAINAIIQLYALRYVGAGLASVVGSALTPIALLGFASWLGQEQLRRHHFVALGLGVSGILLLFGPKALAGRLDMAELFGTLAIIVSSLAYCLGSVLARPLMRTLAPAQMAAMANFLGGIVLLTASILFEPGAIAAMHLNWGIVPWSAWLFLLIPGSLGATTVYFILVRDWGASRAGTYAFISPIVSVLLGIALLGEQVHPIDAIGMVLMLIAAWVALRK